MGLPECKKIYEEIEEYKKLSAISFLKAWIPEKDQIKIKETIVKNRESWFAPYHFYWGMGIRNSLRDAGYGDEYFDMNLDDCYVELVEDAVKENYNGS